MVVVVAAAILDGEGRVLAAQRSAPPELSGRWEFPGGKVEPGESDEQALVRECREELGVQVAVGRRIGPELLTGAGAVLRMWTARLAAGRPEPTEHTALRWLAAGELYDVDWLPADVAVLADLRCLLGPVASAQ